MTGKTGRLTKKTAREQTNGKPSIAIVGAGRLATFLAAALHDAGLTITEIIARASPGSLRKARTLAVKVDARPATVNSAALDATLLWLCVPDREIRGAAADLAAVFAAKFAAKSAGRFAAQAFVNQTPRLAFHSSGALLSRELEPLRNAVAAVASVHPLMTFVAGAHPSLAAVPFALEGDQAAVRVARRIVRELGGESFSLPASRKAAYHAWATMTSPLLLAYLVTLEEAARAAGFSPKDARRRSLPIIRQTLANYASLGPKRSFSGPFVRGDAETVAKHLALLKKNPTTYSVYRTLARAAIARLPIKNRKQLRRLLEERN